MIAPVFRLISHAIDLYSFVLLVAVVVSWVAPQSRHPAVLFIHRITEPVLAPIRKVLPDLGGLDLSPLALLVLLRLIQRFLL
jgi:YggT family protein